MADEKNKTRGQTRCCRQSRYEPVGGPERPRSAWEVTWRLGRMSHERAQRAARAQVVQSDSLCDWFRS